MERARHRSTGRSTLAAALLVLALPAGAQVPGSVQEYRLPPAPSPTATGAGPVDSDHPVAAPTTTTAPAPTPPATPSPGPRSTAPIVAPPLPTPAPAPALASTPAPAALPGTRAAPSPRTERGTTRGPQVQPPPASGAAITPPMHGPGLSPPALPATARPEPAAAATAASLPAHPSGQASAPWPWIAAGTALIGLLGGLLFWRRQALRRDAIAYRPDLPAPQPLPEPSPAPEPMLEPAPAPEFSPAPEAGPPFPAPAAETRPLDMQLEARHLSRALVNATLAYRLTLTNRSDAAAGPLRIAGDIVSAHASLSAEEQLAPGQAALATIHELPLLAPGEEVTFRGELRLPISSILPIHSGGNRVFVPLARFRAEIPGSATTRVFVIGQASGEPGGALRPFSLDRGPGIDRGLGQRELELPA